MANELRSRTNSVSGAINDNPLLIGATTINSPGFADLPIIDVTNHLILTLDPLEVFGAAEIVQVTTHTASATSVTVVRGQEGSVARQHPLNTVWFHGPVASDFALVYRLGHTFTIPGDIVVAVGDADFVCPFFVPVQVGRTTKLVAARHRINAGTSATVKLTNNGVDITGFTALSVTTAPTTTDPADVTLAANDLIALVVTAISGSPKNLSFSLYFEHQ